MAEETADILLISSRIDSAQLRRLVGAYFADMVKYVVDVRRRVVGIGGELHADAENLPALINIRPAQGNRSMEVADKATRQAIREITFELIGQGEELDP